MRKLSEQIRPPIDGPLFKPVATVSEKWLHEIADEVKLLEDALEELQKGIYDFKELPIYAKNFVYRITSKALSVASQESDN